MSPRLLALVSLFALACGQAADSSSPMDGGDVDPSSEETASARPVKTSQPRPLPAAEETVWRTCQADDDCELRDSVCMPLDAGSSETYCRRPLAQLGESCRSANGCELGLVCGWAGIAGSPERACALACGGTDADCLTSERKALACDPQGAGELDAKCEAE